MATASNYTNKSPAEWRAFLSDSQCQLDALDKQLAELDDERAAHSLAATLGDATATKQIADLDKQIAPVTSQAKTLAAAIKTAKGELAKAERREHLERKRAQLAEYQSVAEELKEACELAAGKMREIAEPMRLVSDLVQKHNRLAHAVGGRPFAFSVASKEPMINAMLWGIGLGDLARVRQPGIRFQDFTDPAWFLDNALLRNVINRNGEAFAKAAEAEYQPVTLNASPWSAPEHRTAGPVERPKIAIRKENRGALGWAVVLHDSGDPLIEFDEEAQIAQWFASVGGQKTYQWTTDEPAEQPESKSATLKHMGHGSYQLLDSAGNEILDAPMPGKDNVRMVAENLGLTLAEDA